MHEFESEPAADAAMANEGRDRRFFEWRPARVEDADAMACIYNETVACGGHSPQWTPANAAEMRTNVQASRRQGWPIWCLLRNDEIVACAWIRPFLLGGICRQAGDFSVYVARSWQGSAAAMQCILIAYDLAPRHGFEAMTCWILGTNPRSLQLARAARMAPWGRLPGIANIGGIQADVHIWGARYDDPAARAYMERLKRRLVERARRDGERLGPT